MRNKWQMLQYHRSRKLGDLPLSKVLHTNGHKSDSAGLHRGQMRLTMLKEKHEHVQKNFRA